ncbi:hypothetical protein VN97_g1405 [Penicillium thymicola]|uniref:Uncharacterized protein n=1 Tax=Penicillium thymicola TaxID=293382 RepID=A0AAI9TRP5_PENTH|nr:hypothetical protein VN97_g1405 [Penicillium thymicola]
MNFFEIMTKVRGQGRVVHSVPEINQREGMIESFISQHNKFRFTNELLDAAANVLGMSDEWTRYLKLVDTRDSVDDILTTSDRWPGSFSPARSLQ